MSSQWVDANGDQWRFSTSTSSWLRLVNGQWIPATLPAGGLQRVSTGTPAETVTAPAWPDYDPTPNAPEWVDNQGQVWRQQAGIWQKLIGNTWVTAPLPSGGLRRLNAGEEDREVVIVETMGPRGPQGETGPPGLTYLAISQVLPAQFQNGVNATFALSDTADLSQAIQVFRNGLLEIPGLGYLVTETSVTFTTPPLDSDVIAVVYQKAQ
jgi:hypothetical protein